MWIRGLLTAVALVASTSALAQDRVVDVSSVDGVVSLLHEAGYKAEVKTGSDGSNYIVSGVGGNDFQVVFYGCKSNAGCDSFELYSWYKKKPYFSAELANEWNVKRRFLKVAIDNDGDLAEYLYVSALGKMTYANFKDYLDWYASMDSDLSKFLEEKGNAAGSK